MMCLPLVLVVNLAALLILGGDLGSSVAVAIPLTKEFDHLGVAVANFLLF